MTAKAICNRQIMMACRKMLLNQRFFTATRVFSSYSTKAATLVDQMANYDKRLSKKIDKKEAKPPFAKNLVLGIFDFDILAFPEAQDTERNKCFFDWLKPIEDYMKTVDPQLIDRTMTIPEEVLHQLNELGVLGAYIPEEFGGLGLLESEYMKLLETLSRVPALALYLAKLNRCVDLLTRFASSEQKLKYLPQIANGIIVPTCCISEHRTENPKQISTMGLLSSDHKYYILKGEKIFVPYVDRANLFLVFALLGHSTDNVKDIQKSLSLILIEKNLPNIVIGESIETVGIRALPHFTVQFNDVQVDKKNVVGNIGGGIKMFTDFMTLRKHDTGPVAIGLLRNFIDTLSHYIINTNHFHKKLYEYESSKEVLGKACAALYSMEAATYLTTSLMDLHQDQDCTMESTIVQTYCSSQCVKSISEGIHLIGTQAYLRENHYDLFYRDAHALTVFENSVIDNETLVALLGMQHTGTEMSKEVRKLRNPFQYPWFNIIFWDKRLRLKLREYLHPSLQEPAKRMEIILFNLRNETLELLTRHGANIAENHMDLRRFYEVVALTYMVSSVMARASRAYCIGLRNAEQEIQLAHLLSYKAIARVKDLHQEIMDQQWYNGDKYYKEITDRTLERKEYLAEHPLTRNF